MKAHSEYYEELGYSLMVNEIFFAYLYQDGCYRLPIQLVGREAVLEFLRNNLYAEELRLCDASDQLLCQIVNGVDLVNKLDEISIDLKSLFSSGKRDPDSSGKINRPIENWEVLYDRIGLSPGEVRMRQRIKHAARNARTVDEVANLIFETYFTAFFYTADESRAWGYLDAQDLSASVFTREVLNDGSRWVDTEKTVRLDPEARVRHRSSSEDKHYYTLLDPPEVPD